MRLRALAFAGVLMFGASAAIDAAPRRPTRTVHVRTVRHRRGLAKKAGWAGAGFAAGEIAGPAGSAGVGAAKYRHDLAAGGRRRTHAAVKIGAPIAAGLAAGPAGSAAYEAYDHRRWIKRHVLHTGNHHPHSDTHRHG